MQKTKNMKIACIGWGSLIWRPETLLIHRKWYEDGPVLPVEFARQSRDGRLTLVILKNSKPVRTMWALMLTDNLEEAKKSLLDRESIPENKMEEYIGVIKSDDETKDEISQTIKEWLNKLDLDAAIWTNLPPKFKKENNKAPTLEEALTYLKNLKINTFQTAIEYINKTPKQIDTPYRQGIEKEFNL